MAKHIFFFAAVALVVIVQQNDAAIIKLEDVQGVPLVADEYISNVTRSLKSSVGDVQQKFDSKFERAETFLQSSIDKYVSLNEDTKKKIEAYVGEHNCHEIVDTYKESYDKLFKTSTKCVDSIKELVKSNVDIIQGIETKVENRLVELKEKDEQCKTKEDSTDITNCATKVINDAMIELAKETGPLNMKVEKLNEQLSTVLLELDSCTSTYSITMLGKNFHQNVQKVENCLQI